MQSSRSIKIESELSLLTLFALLEIIYYQTAEAVKIFIIIDAIYVNILLHFDMASDNKVEL